MTQLNAAIDAQPAGFYARLTLVDLDTEETIQTAHTSATLTETEARHALADLAEIAGYTLHDYRDFASAWDAMATAARAQVIASDILKLEE